MKLVTVSILCFLFLNLVSDIRAIEITDRTDARSYAMGNLQSVLPGFINPSSYGFTSSFRHFSLQYTNRFGIKELSTWTAGINYPNKFLNTGLIVSRYGMKAYHETFAGLNVYKKLSGYISLGVRINYLNIHYSAKESNRSVFTADIGMYLPVSDCFTFSLLAVNPLFIRMKTENTKEKLPSALSIGVSYQPIETFILTGEIEKNFVLPVSCKLGFEYTPVKELSMRAGLFTSPLTPTFGVGLHLSFFTVDVAFGKQSVLGFQSRCAIQFEF